MKTRIVRIGNSQGIRIPKTVLAQCGLARTVELEVGKGRLVIRSARRPRHGWDRAFARAVKDGDDGLRDWRALAPSSWDRKEWAW